MEWDSESALQGFLITMIVCIVSSVLYYMFRNTLFPHRISVHQDSENLARRRKKNDVKKSKKVKKRKVLVDSQQTEEIETDKTQTSGDTTGEEDEHLSDVLFDDYSSSSSEQSVERSIQPVIYEENCDKGDSEVVDASTHKIEQSYVGGPSLDFSQATLSRNQSEDSDSIISPGSSERSPTTDILPPVNDSKVPLTKSKKSKRRSGKRLVRYADLSKEAIFVEPANMEHSSESLEISRTDCLKPYKMGGKQELSNDSTSTLELRTTIKELEGQLKISETKLAETSQWANSLVEENKHFRTKKDESSLSLHVLQMQYNELLRTNKTLEHQNNLLNVKLKNIETENCDLQKRLDQTNADTLKVKKEAELELCNLREQLTKHETQLTAMAKAMAASTPSIPTGPIPELIRAQELAQAMSNDNCLLKSRIEQLDSELTQLRQTNMRQQQDLQVFRAENHKLHSEKETALDELRIKRQADGFKDSVAKWIMRWRSKRTVLGSNPRVNINSEMQELSISLSEARAELSRSLQKEKRQSEIISSLEYQFAELNVQKQCLLDNANQSKLAYETASSELRAQVVNLSNDLIRVTNELNNTEQKVYELTYQLESTTKSSSNNNDLNGEPIIINIKSDETCISKQDEQHENELLHISNNNIYEDLRNRLSEVETNFNVAEKERAKFYILYQSALNEVDHYKSTLIQTEEVLAKLEESVKQTESKWRQLLSESEFEQIQLRKQLSESQSMLKDITGKLNQADEGVPALKICNVGKRQKKSKTRKPVSSSLF
ncbi:unnamed protein product [Schistosoma margrebowiei]|uniref:Uncharacterized protein n=1 Tax=Schistosoma margrebowiei TaxID=48269 RepID=A0A183LHN2_9TREM|nr:unnamed protein product [Schistosoma margrebowiei]